MLAPGMAASRSRVYCSFGLSNTSSVVAASTMRPLLHHADVVGDDAHDREVVGDEEVRQAELGLQVGEQAQDLRLHEHVERRDRLVEDDDLGLQRERTRDGDALALAARELVRVAAARACAAATPGRAARRPRSRRDAWSPTLCVAQRLRDRVADVAQRVQRAVRVLEDRLHAAAEIEQLLAAHASPGRSPPTTILPLVGVLELQQQLRDGRLARARLAHERHGGALRDLERDVVDRREVLARPPADLEDLGEVLDHDRRGCAAAASSASARASAVAIRSIASPPRSLRRRPWPTRRPRPPDAWMRREARLGAAATSRCV